MSLEIIGQHKGYLLSLKEMYLIKIEFLKYKMNEIVHFF